MPKSAVASNAAISKATSFTSPSFLRSARPLTITTASGTSSCRTAASVFAKTTTSIEPVVSSISAKAIWSPLRVTSCVHGQRVPYAFGEPRSHWSCSRFSRRSVCWGSMGDRSADPLASGTMRG